MRLITFRADGASRLGVLRDQDEVVEVSEPGDMLSLIDAGEDGLAAAGAALSSSRSKARRLADLELLSPLRDPRGNVIAVGRNYQKHAEETAVMEGREPSPPTIFTKAVTSLTEPFADIAIRNCFSCAPITIAPSSHNRSLVYDRTLPSPIFTLYTQTKYCTLAN